MVLRAEERQKLHAPLRNSKSDRSKNPELSLGGNLPDGMTVFAYRRYFNASTGVLCLPANC
jgi:hypothetical protein